MLNEETNYKIQNFILAETKNKDKMAKLQLKDMESENVINCVIWNDTLESLEPNVLRNGNIIRVLESEYTEKFNNYKLKDLTLVEEAILGLSKEKRESYYNKIFAVVESLENNSYKVALMDVLIKNEEEFKTSSAARVHHHSYVGGLIQHTAECVQIAKTLMKVIPTKVNEDLVLASCISHDFGKMFEYNTDLETGITTSNEQFVTEWISHLHWGFSWANQNGLPELAHVIGSHHGLKEWGALIEPQTNEAKLMHQIDMISSKLGKTSIEQLQ